MNYLKKIGKLVGSRGLENYYKLCVRKNMFVAEREFDYIADPFKMIHVDPHEIEYVTFQFNRRKETGKVVTGDWDTNSEPKTVFDDFQSGSLQRYDGYYNHFENGVPWDETHFYEQASKRIKQGERVVSRESISELDTYLAKMDSVYEDMKKEGYKSMYELTGPEHAASGTLRSLLDDVVVVITRDGTIWRAGGGRHRHILARFLDLDVMKVRVAIRHHKWQEIRDNHFKNGIETNSNDLSDHPDMVNIHQ